MPGCEYRKRPQKIQIRHRRPLQHVGDLQVVIVPGVDNLVLADKGGRQLRLGSDFSLIPDIDEQPLTSFLE